MQVDSESEQSKNIERNRNFKDKTTEPNGTFQAIIAENTQSPLDSELLAKHKPKSPSYEILTYPLPVYENEAVSLAISKFGLYEFAENNDTYRDSVFLPPIFNKNSDSIYIGQWKLGKMHGQAKVFWTDGSIYEGYFSNNQANGMGRMIHSNGDVYIGEWKNDMTNGKGKYYKKNGAVYDGYWKEDQKHGKCKEIYPDGTIFEGEYVEGVKASKGIIIFPSGDFYEGEFQKNRMHGYGVFLWRDGKKYKGHWVAGKKNGRGETIWLNGDRFIGEYHNDIESSGEFIWSDGSRFIGTLSEGLMHGKGVFVDPLGHETLGYWVEGKLLKKLVPGEKFLTTKVEETKSRNVTHSDGNYLESHRVVAKTGDSQKSSGSSTNSDGNSSQHTRMTIKDMMGEDCN